MCGPEPTMTVAHVLTEPRDLLLGAVVVEAEASPPEAGVFVELNILHDAGRLIVQLEPVVRGEPHAVHGERCGAWRGRARKSYQQRRADENWHQFSNTLTNRKKT